LSGEFSSAYDILFWILSLMQGGVILIAVAFHVVIVTFLWGLKDALEDSVFQLASMLIAVPFCTNFIPGVFGLLAWIISQLHPVELSISLFSVWNQIASFFVANSAAWFLVDYETGFLMGERRLAGCV
jgi:hypothetical protein